MKFFCFLPLLKIAASSFNLKKYKGIGSIAKQVIIIQLKYNNRSRGLVLRVSHVKRAF